LTIQPKPSWNVLLLGGCSAIGKTTLAQNLAKHFGISAVLSDDVWFGTSSLILDGNRLQVYCDNQKVIIEGSKYVTNEGF
jgi:uridine kinase